MPTNLKKKYFNYPEPKRKASKSRRMIRIATGIFLSPIYWLLAYIVNTPGLKFRKYFMVLGLRILAKTHNLRNSHNLIVAPMDSFRYFEFDFMWQSVENIEIKSYLDVSSPRLFPLMLIDRKRNIDANLLNPDKRDLAETISMTETLNIEDRCSFYTELIADAPLNSSSFDLITSMSVIEHIADDKEAIQTMWSLLRPGGKLLITLPCSAEAYEEYMNRNDYELLNPSEDGYIFFQRFYDEPLLMDRIFSITGKPHRYQIYGEKQSGTYQANEFEKRTNPLYPYWRDPFQMGLQYEYKSSVSELPGMGVIAFEFRKN